MTRGGQRRRRSRTRYRLPIVGIAVVLVAVALTLLNAWPASPPTVEQPIALANWYEIRFTSPASADGGLGGPSGTMDKRLVEFVDGAQRSIDVAIYDFDLENVASALAAAQRRGVRVRMVTDTDTFDSRNEDVQHALDLVRNAGIPIVHDERSAIMHHKFAVRDDEWVWTGSWNFTRGDTDRLNNNAVILRVPALAENFATEFEKMFVDREFGPRKSTALPHPLITADDARIETCFAPEMRCDDLIVDVVRSAQQSVHFMAFSFTHDGIGDAMLDRHRAGVEVTGVFETTGSETEFSEYGRLAEAGVAVHQDGNQYPMHHKVIVVDGQTVIFGSFNFSASAANANDENLLVVTDAAFAAAFESEFGRILDAATRREASSVPYVAADLSRWPVARPTWAGGQPR